MTRKVKTIKIDDLKARANKVFRDSEDDYKQGRRYTQAFVENVLMETGNYMGFGYLSADRAAEGKSFGIALHPETHEPIFYDQTRIEFF